MLRRKPTRLELGGEDKKELEAINIEKGKLEQKPSKQKTKEERIYGINAPSNKLPTPLT